MGWQRNSLDSYHFQVCGCAYELAMACYSVVTKGATMLKILCGLVTLALAAPVAAAAQDVALLSIDSDIREATVYVAGVAQERTPFMLSIPTPAGLWKSARNCVNSAPISVKWVSGAEASVPSIQLCSENGTQQHIVFNRPDEFPDWGVDTRWAAQLDLFRRQIGFVVSQAMLTGQKQARIEPPAPPVVAPRPAMNCRSKLQPGAVYTTRTVETTCQ